MPDLKTILFQNLQLPAKVDTKGFADDGGVLVSAPDQRYRDLLRVQIVIKGIRRNM